MNIEKNNKHGFKSAYTLMEACVVMIIVSIFIMVMASVVPHKIKNKVESDAHGHFECYWEKDNNGVDHLYQQTFIEANSSYPEEVTMKGYCTFEPQNYTRFLIFNAVGGGAEGAAGRFVSTFFNSSIAQSYKISPGKYGTDSGGNTEIKDNDGANVLIASGGSNPNNGPEGYTIDNISSCVMSTTLPRTETGHGNYDASMPNYDNAYACDKGPLCEIDNGRVKVSYCRTQELYKTSYLPYRSADVVSGNYVDTQYIADEAGADTMNTKGKKWNANSKTITYCDHSLFEDYGNTPDVTWLNNLEDDCYNSTLSTPSLYRMEITLSNDISAGFSQMTDYIQMLQYEPANDMLARVVNCVKASDADKDDACDALADYIQIGPGDAGTPASSSTDAVAGGSGAVLILW